MADVQDQISVAHLDVEKAQATVTKAVRERRVAGRGGPFTQIRDAELSAARKSLSDAEAKLRQLYESKDDGGYRHDGRLRYRLG
jgi:hypothetical protein